MHRHRFAYLIACAHVIVLLALPSAASAATAPSLQAPAVNASATEGESLKFEWDGELQGDSDALDRSFFRVEVIKASDMPSGAQSEWPSSDLENTAPTAPGVEVGTLSLGVPPAGSYRWRVCAWGVVDDLAANEIVQLPGGCSVSRAFTTVAASTTKGTIGELRIEEKTQVAGETRTVYVEREDPAQDPAPQTEAPADPDPIEEVEELVESTFTGIGSTSIERGAGSAVGGIASGDGEGDFDAEATADRKGVAGAIRTGLGATLPLVPIPFWTLALLLACFPVALLWRRSVLGMFDWNDGSIDGRGGYADVIDDLALVPVDREVKVRSTTADGVAAAPAPVATPSAPDRGRRAA